MIFPEAVSGERYKWISQMLHMKHNMDVIAEAWAEMSQSCMEWCGKIFVIFEALTGQGNERLKEAIWYTGRRS